MIIPHYTRWCDVFIQAFVDCMNSKDHLYKRQEFDELVEAIKRDTHRYNKIYIIDSLPNISAL